MRAAIRICRLPLSKEKLRKAGTKAKESTQLLRSLVMARWMRAAKTWRRWLGAGGTCLQTVQEGQSHERRQRPTSAIRITPHILVRTNIEVIEAKARAKDWPAEATV